MELNLIRPLTFIDLETTGTDITNDRIVQIAALKMLPGGKEEILKWIINPTIPIPISASKVHGIYDETVKNAQTFAEIAPTLVTYIENSDIAGYNSNNFDIPLLLTEFSRAAIDFNLEGRNLIDVQTIFHRMEPRNLKAAYKFYCDKNLINAHDAENDIRATYEIFKAQLKKYENVAYEDEDGRLLYPIVNNLDALSSFTAFNFIDPTKRVIYDEHGREIFNFGKYKGKTLVEVFKEDASYYSWIMNNNFSIFTKKIIKQVWESVKNQAT